MMTTLRRKFETAISLEEDAFNIIAFSEKDDLLDLRIEDGVVDYNDFDALVGVMCWTKDCVYVTYETQGCIEVAAARRNPPEAT